ncbi:hypothetical protein ARAF_2962 [Arsenophonus endosymbiont of Aleurodicus floccissimus]|uniref:hypothetical protein n=1 Tax=Arsenophonus endosymbiont of Aleurodicus floccissimus TaxID=2152761 RepID=UPI000E6AFDE1|nr:hypothetical protein [Arsenophonus endosymbiont of Aleurodicus floccissimus]SPP32621.1 hypothetical protein ARAF_2962 [Arsenophonus endosymbiont of Aleurodicus floccissimus]
MSVFYFNKLKQFSQLFPEFTQTQQENVFLFAIGIPISNIADVRHVYIRSVQASLIEAQHRLELGSISSLRAVAQMRLFLPLLRLAFYFCNEKSDFDEV